MIDIFPLIIIPLGLFTTFAVCGAGIIRIIVKTGLCVWVRD